jgi:hypothetical protein
MQGIRSVRQSCNVTFEEGSLYKANKTLPINIDLINKIPESEEPASLIKLYEMIPTNKMIPDNDEEAVKTNLVKIKPIIEFTEKEANQHEHQPYLTPDFDGEEDFIHG